MHENFVWMMNKQDEEDGSTRKYHSAQLPIFKGALSCPS